VTTLAKLSGKSDLAGTIVRHLDQTKHCYAIYPRASGADRRIANPPVTRRLSSVITITGTGDHLRLDQPIIFTGMCTD
jgi:hypothetical protein